MSTNKQRLLAKLNLAKVIITSHKKKLLLTAVVLFCLSGAIIFPVKIENLESLFSSKSTKEKITKSQNQELINSNFCFSNNFLVHRHSMALANSDTLASLNISHSQEENEKPQEGIDLITANQNILLNQNNPITLVSQKPRTETIAYTVRSGDMPSTIAASFGISLNTLLWANDLNEGSIIRPGDELTILPIDGLIHRAKNGETVGAIATKYRANTEKIIAFNELPADGSIQIGQKLVIPDGKMPASQPKPTPTYTTRSYVASSNANQSRSFPYGQCTWYVAQKRYVPWSGHAKAWLVNARAYGFSTGSTPQARAIMVMQGGNWLGRVYGHVAYVESINGEWVTISEMNHVGWAIKSVRTIHRDSSLIKGYIY